MTDISEKSDERFDGPDETGKANAGKNETGPGGGLVTIELAGGGNMKSLKLDPSLFGSAEQDDMEMAEDLIIAAYQDAKVKLDEAQAKTMKDAMGDIPLPPGMNLPF